MNRTADGTVRDRTATDSAGAPLLARAEVLLRQQDITGARLVLQRALRDGEYPCCLSPGPDIRSTCSRFLETWGVQAEPAKARELYLLAQTSGIDEAGSYLQLMQ